VAFAGYFTTQFDGLFEPQLTVKRWPSVAIMVFSFRLSADDRRHLPTLRKWVARHARSIPITASVRFSRTNALQPDLLACLTVDRAIDIMDCDGEAKEGETGHRGALGPAAQ